MWLLSLKFLVRGLGIVSTFILVRLLSPSDFGVNAIAMSIFGFIDIFSRFGFDTVLIQKNKIDRYHYDTAWSLSFLFGIFSFIILFIFSSKIANFYDNEDLKFVLIIISFIFVINGCQNIGTVDFRKNLTFNKEFKLQIIPKFISFFITLVLAFWLKNYWSLIIGTLVWRVLICVFGYVVHPYRPKFSLKAFYEFFNFSKWLFLGNFIQFFNRKSPELIIGKLISPQSAGLFSVGSEMSSFVTSELIANVNRAAYPGYSKVSQDLNKLKQAYVDVISSITIWVFPAGAGLSAVASLFVPVVLGPQWVESVGIVIYLSLANLLLSLNSNAVYIFLALAKPKISTCVSLMRILIFIPSLIIMIDYNDVVGASQAVFIASIATYLIYTFFMVKILNLNFYDLIKINFRPFVSTFIMFFLVIYIKNSDILIYIEKDKYALLLCVLFGIVTYSISLLFLWYISGCPDGPEKNIFKQLYSKLHF